MVGRGLERSRSERYDKERMIPLLKRGSRHERRMGASSEEDLIPGGSSGRRPS